MSRRVLAPATVLPVVGLCSQKLVLYADGNAYPLRCRSGAVNVLAWKFYVPIDSNVMSLGRSATLQAIQQALCRDMSAYHATRVEAMYAYNISAAYYGWKFPADQTCP